MKKRKKERKKAKENLIINFFIKMVEKYWCLERRRYLAHKV